MFFAVVDMNRVSWDKKQLKLKEVGDRSRERPEVSLLDSDYTEV